MARRTL